ncbi:MAG: glutamate synthase NADH/NADPH small subunit [Ignavibacteria bacterium]|nr:MAG: glutamate synthase NADH/NADPH small subunit [Ignavibacteria bacterium]KAF0159582.1 MAG: glutamate synthase NADH/NADPH small subunit [Ignavibacteria bacterium]
MGKPTGFMEFDRAYLRKDPPDERIAHNKEFEKRFSSEKAKTQAARCMDCGIPFCHGDTGCPVQNYIPEWNDLVYKGHFKEALENLHSTNNFPEFTGRLCPAPCETACTLEINKVPVSIKAIERTIIDKGFEEGWIKPRLPHVLSKKTIAIVGSGPSGLAAAQQLCRSGHTVTVYEKNDRVGGLLRYGIPDFKLEKNIIDRRIRQMKVEGVTFRTSVYVGKDISAKELFETYDAVILAGGSEKPRDISIPGRELKGIHFAMEYLSQQNKIIAGDKIEQTISAKEKNVVVLGGGDTGSDCVGTANRQGAKSVIQIEVMPKPPVERQESSPWPYYPMILRTSTSQDEGVERLWSINTTSFSGNENGVVIKLNCVEVKNCNGKFENLSGTEFTLDADLVLIAAGFLQPEPSGLITELVELGLQLDARGNVKADFGDTEFAHQTSLSKVFACGDMRRGQSLIVWAIAEGRKCAEAVHKFLSELAVEENAA